MENQDKVIIVNHDKINYTQLKDCVFDTHLYKFLPISHGLRIILHVFVCQIFILFSLLFLLYSIFICIVGYIKNYIIIIIGQTRV